LLVRGECVRRGKRLFDEPRAGRDQCQMSERLDRPDRGGGPERFREYRPRLRRVAGRREEGAQLAERTCALAGGTDRVGNPVRLGEATRTGGGDSRLHLGLGTVAPLRGGRSGSGGKSSPRVVDASSARVAFRQCQQGV
jgi:hypothetical protein